MSRGAQDALKGLPSGAAQTVVGVPQLGARIGSALGAVDPKWNDYFAETQQTLKQYGSPEGQFLGSMAPYVLAGPVVSGGRALLGGAAGLAGEIPGMAAVGEYLAPVGEAIASGAKAIGSKLPSAETVFPEKLVKGYRWLTGAAPEAEAAAEAATAETATAGGEAATALNAPKAKEQLSAAQMALKSLRETGKGATTGGVMGAVAPRAEGTQDERDAAMWDSLESGLGWGAAFGLGGEAISAIKEARSSWSLERQRKALELSEKALEDIRQKTAEGAKGAISLRVGNLEDIQKRIAAAKTELTPMQQKIDELAKASRTAEQRELYESTDAQARDIAGKTNLTKEQAEASVKEQKRLLDAIKEETEKQSAERFAGTKTTSDVELGETATPKIEKLKAELEEHRSQASGLSELDAIYDAKGAVFPTEPMLSAIKSEIEGLTAGAKGNPTVNYLTRLYTRIEDTAKEFGGLTRKQLDDFRLEVKDAVNNGIIDSAGGVRRAGADLKKLEPVTNSITKSFDAVDKRYTNALKNYGTLSEALAPFEKEKGVFTGTTDKYYGGPSEMPAADKARQILDLTNRGEKGLDELIKADPSLKDTFREYLHGELFGASKESASDVTAKALDEFRKKNAQVLKSAGLTEEFADLSQARRANEQTIKNAEKRLAEAKELEGETGKRLSKEEAIRADQRKTLEESAAPHRKTVSEGAEEIEAAKKEKRKITRTLTRLEEAAVTPEDKITEVGRAIEVLEKRAPEYMTDEKYKELVRELTQAKTAYGNSKDELKLARDLKAILLSKVVVEAIGSLGFGYGTYRLLGGGRSHE